MRIRVAVLALFVCISCPVTGAPSDGPPLPYLDRGACPFECCRYREWTVEADTPVRSRRDSKAPLVFTAKRGESVHGLTGVVVTVEPGRVRVLQDGRMGGDDGVSVAKGTLIYSLHYQGEGYSLLWHDGKTYSDFVPSVENFRRNLPVAVPHDMGLRPESDPKTIWWILIENANGDVGWSEHPENFGNKDACG